MPALLTLSHGSRHLRAAAGIASLTRRAGRLLQVTAESAHLEFSRPTLTEAAARLVAAGYESATVVPLLFSDAYHHRTDVPVALQEAEAATGLRLTLGAHLGLGEDIAALLAAEVPTGAHVVVYPVGTSNTAATWAINQLASRVGELARSSAEVICATGGPGTGVAGLRAVAKRHPRVHLAPLFVTHGLLLDQALSLVGGRITASGPLGDRLAEVVADRALRPSLLAVGA